MSLFKNKHANQRFFERVHPDTASKKEIIKAVQDTKNIQYIKRLTESRSMAYIHLPNNNIVKVILNKRKREIVTILPWQDDYKVSFDVSHETLGDFTICMFPDCYIETKSSTTLTKIKNIKTTEYIPFSSPDFEIIFQEAWNQYMGQNDETPSAA